MIKSGINLTLSKNPKRIPVNAFWVFFIILFNCNFASAQKQSAHWFFGDSTAVFFSDTGLVTLNNSGLYAIEGSASISDTLGNLLFYTTGWQVWNKNGALMENGDSIGDWKDIPDYQNNNLSSITQAVLILPDINVPGSYYVYSNYKTSLDLRLFYTRIDMNLNSGLGKVIERDVSVIDNSTSIEKLQAVKHGNGRDWWIIYPELLDYTMPFNPEDSSYQIIRHGEGGVVSIKEQAIGYSDLLMGIGESTFSQQGDKYAIVGFSSVEVREFDRCEGQIGERLFIDTSFVDFETNIYGCEFSPDGTKLYITNVIDPPLLMQYDLSLIGQPNFNRDTIFEFFNSHSFGQLQIGIDNKVYMAATRNDPISFSDTISSYLHRINNPNLPGPLCDFELHAHKISPGVNLIGLPNLPNYALGALEGSPCDTLNDVTGISEIQLNNLVVWPTLTKGLISISLDKVIEVVEVYNSTGILLEQHLFNNKFVQLNLSRYSQGMYFIKCKSEDYDLAAVKIIKIN